MKYSKTLITPEEEQQFNDFGYLIIPNALPSETVEQLIKVLDDLTPTEPKNYNVADILGIKKEFLKLLDLPTVLPKVQKLLGENIWVNHSHFNVNPPHSNEQKVGLVNDFGWHRDGGAINSDIPPPAPLLSIKVGFYLTDLSVLGRGQTYIIQDSHSSGEQQPDNLDLPLTAKPLCVSPGTAILYDRRTIHSTQSRNISNITRKAIFIQYAFRWLSPVDAMSVEHLQSCCSPTLIQLLGLSVTYNTIDGAEGRSSRYYT